MNRVINSLFVRFFVFLTYHLLFALAVVNVTIDDTHGDPITGVQIQYNPPSDWPYGPDCGYCMAKPDAASASSGTWHDNLYTSNDARPGGTLPTAEVKFTGVAVYVYGILYAGNPGTTDLAFQIDGETMGTYSQPVFDSSEPLYNMLLFTKQSLPSTLHTLTIVNGASRGSTGSLLLLDYIVYSQEEKGTSSQESSSGSSVTHTTTSPKVSPTSTTTSDSTQTSSTNTTHTPSTATNPLGQTNPSSLANPNPTQSNSPNSTWVSSPTSATGNTSKTPAIIGAVIGSLAAIIVFLVLFFICRRRRRQRYPGENNDRLAAPFRTALPRAVIAERPAEKLPFPDASVSEFSEQPTTTAEAASTTTETTHPRMVPVEAALTLAAEVDRLREMLRLQEPLSSTQPPPYVHQDPLAEP